MVSVQHFASHARLRRISTRRSICSSLQLFPKKIQSLQLLTAAAIYTHETFLSAILQQLGADEIGKETFGSTMKRNFPLDIFVNKQNWSIWGNENLHIAVALNTPKVMVWAIPP